MSRKLEFGQYRGKDLDLIIKVDPEYVNWAAKTIEWLHLSDAEIRALHESFEREAARRGVYRYSLAYLPQVDHAAIIDRVSAVETLPAFGGGTYDKVTYVSGRVEERNHQYYTGDE